jgi:hypothetical protein
MSGEVFVMGTLGFAVMGAILYVWGYRKARRAPRQLHQRMGQVIERQIQLCLTERPQGATRKEIAKAIAGLSVGNQLQGYKLEVADTDAAAGAVLDRMIDRGIVSEQGQGKSRKYVLRLPEEA